jgi:ornithine--oxo-acid transaminase
VQKTQIMIEKTKKFGTSNYSPLDVVLEKGKGIWTWDVDGKKYMDMLSSYSALNHGHLHPKIIKRVKKQLDKLTIVSRAYYTDKLAEFSEKITSFTGFNKVLPMNSGAEAVETAVKIARKWAYEVKKIPKHDAEIIVCKDNFHGRTTTIVSFSSDESYKDNFGPFTPGFKIVPFGDINAIKQAINKNTAAVLIEPIQGEGGVNIPPQGFLKDLSALCKANNVLLVLDEIQTGFGRTGKSFCYQWEGIRPDILIVAKALGGGIMPISAVLGDTAVMGLLKPGEHGSTFGGNPIACECALAAIDVFVDENLAENSNEVGSYFLSKLKQLSSSPKIKDIRGRGLLIGVELHKEAGGARKYCEELLEKGVLCKDTHGTVIRFTPPLIIKKENIDWAFKRIAAVLG